MNRLSAMARRSSLPKRIDRPCADAYCSAASAASMLAVSAARNAVSGVTDLVSALAALPFPFPLPLPLPFGLTRAPLPSAGDPGISPCAVALCAGAAELSGCTTQSTNRRLPSRRSARQIANGSFCRMPSSTSLSRTSGGTYITRPSVSEYITWSPKRPCTFSPSAYASVAVTGTLTSNTTRSFMVHLSVIYLLAIRGLVGFMHTYGVHLSPSVQSWRSGSAGNRHGALARLLAQRRTQWDLSYSVCSPRA